MPLPTPTSVLATPSHSTLHGSYHNVKSYGATGDGSTDDTAAIQDAIDAAQEPVDGKGHVYFPSGDYIISDTLSLDGDGGYIRLSGATNRNADGSPGLASGTRIYGNLAAPLIERTLALGGAQVTIEDMAFRNLNATGTCISLVGVSMGGIFRCSMMGNKCVVFGEETFSTGVFNCRFGRVGTIAGSIGVTLNSHIHVHGCDFQGFGTGIYSTITPASIGCSIIGGRIEVCQTGIATNGFGGVISGVYFEANDTAISLNGCGATHVNGCTIHGSVGAPSGQSLVGIDVGECFSTIVSGVQESNFAAHSTAFVRVASTGNRFNLTFISVFGQPSSAGWSLPTDKHDITIINCSPEKNLGVYTDSQVNVKEYGAKGDGVTDDTASIQAAIDAASVIEQGHVVIPAGHYKVTSSLTLDSSNAPCRISGVHPMNPDQAQSGTRIFGNFAGPIFERTDSAGTLPYILEDMTIQNQHTTGTCVSLVGMESPGGLYRCYVTGHRGLILGDNTFGVAVSDCRFSIYGTTYAGSIGVQCVGHGYISNFDLAGYEVGLALSGPATAVIGGRVETCGTGAYVGYGTGFRGTISSVNFEGNDKAIFVKDGVNTVIQGCHILSHAGSPSGGSLFGIDFDNTFGVTVINLSEAGAITAGARIQGAAQRNQLTLIGCDISSWAITEYKDLTIINSNTPDVVRAPVIATASLPAAATTQNGRIIIEDAGTGNRNLILYAGGQRFRIDGGANV